MPIHRHPINDEASWLKLRQGYLTASEVSVLYGAHPFATIAEVMARKRGLLPLKQEDTTLMKRGRVLEKVAADEVGKLRPQWQITKATEFVCDDIRRIGATPDFYVQDAGQRAVLDTKVVSSRVFEREWAPGLPPLWILLQVQLQMLLDDCHFGAVGALVIGEHEFDCQVYEIPRHGLAEKKLLDDIAHFWTLYDKQLTPEFDFARDRAAIRALYPTHTEGKHLDLTTDNRLNELLVERQKLKDIIDTNDAKLTMIENEIAAKLADAETAQCGDWQISYKRQDRKAYEVKATSFRVLRAKNTTAL